MGTLLGLHVLMVPGAARGTDVTEVLQRMADALETARDLRASATFIIESEHGERIRWSAQYYRRSGPDGRMRLIFEDPIDLRGVDLTVRRREDEVDEIRVYFPAIRRVRLLDADMRGESFLGTDFNYEDLGLEDLDFQKHTLLDDGEFEGEPCYRVRSVPAQSWFYGEIVRCIDKKSFLPRRTEYHSPAGQHYKTRTLDVVETIDEHTIPTRIAMRNLVSGTSTTIVYSDVILNSGLKESIFVTTASVASGP